MKTKSLLLGILLLGVCACTGISPAGMPESSFTNAPAPSFKVSQNDLSTYFSLKKGISNETKLSQSVTVLPIITNNDTVMYLVNYEEGWEVLSADKRVPVVLMMCDKGNITENELYSNPYQSDYVEGMKDAISDLMSGMSIQAFSDEDNWNGVMPMDESYDTWTPWRLVGTHIDSICKLADQDHLLRTHWGQSGNWKIKAPYTSASKITHCPTGCVMVAGSQTLYYLHYRFRVPENTYGDCICNAYIKEREKSVKLNSSNCSFPEESLGNMYWDLMPLDKNSSSVSGFAHVSSLMSHLGYLISANYSVGSTSASTYKLSDAFKYSYSIDSRISYDYDFDIIFNQISKEKLPCIFAIGRSDGIGHAVVVDGCRHYRVHTMFEYVKNNNRGDIQRMGQQVVTYKNYIAINLGWYGSADYDSTTKATIWYNAETVNWQDYTEFRYMIYDFKPIQ